ncbi:hypothetical protein V2I93_09310, partial [Pseudomonas viridiflava]|uniref:hypothetical protein n=1 Tax=Pseudomonas viridiflava TaxID=33069 RepID=UPI002ECEAAE2|nr:hypothetical protein [Pseudomonas viridiflava]
ISSTLERNPESVDTPGFSDRADHLITAESFFIRNGFEIVERRHSVSRGVELPNALMRRRM